MRHPCVPDVAIEAANQAWVDGYTANLDGTAEAIDRALDAWPRGDLLKRLLTVECGVCEGSGTLMYGRQRADAVSVECLTCHGRGRVVRPLPIQTTVEEWDTWVVLVLALIASDA